jgi:glycosyltransferase involved in cell wall biosynthesis
MEGDDRIMGISVILLNYEREHNIAKITESIRKQTVPAEIIFINNGGDLVVDADVIVNNNQNLGCYMRILMAHYAKYEHVLLMDDDLMIADELLFRSLEESVWDAKIVGAWGEKC